MTRQFPKIGAFCRVHVFAFLVKIGRKRMVRPERFELPTFWFVAVVARETNDLHGML